MIRSEERLVFAAFRECCPNFAGRPVTCRDGADPPDFICVDASDKRIAVELGEWLNETQMHSSKKKEALDHTFLRAIDSEHVQPPKNVAVVYIAPKGLGLGKQDVRTFVTELLSLVQEIDADWSDDKRSPTGGGLGGFRSGAAVDSTWLNRRAQFYRHQDFSRYRCLGRYLAYLQCQARGGPFNTKLGQPWLSCKPRAGAYATEDGVEALLDLLDDKIGKYGDLRRQQRLDELCLVAYYNKGWRHNTPFIGPNCGLGDIARLASRHVDANPGPFDKIFLFNAIKQDLEVIQLYTAYKALA